MSAKDTRLSIVPPQIGNVANLQDVATLTPEVMAATIREDIAIFDKHTRLAAFVALRVGLRLLWVRDNGEHGDMKHFIDAHLQGIARRSLTNYMNVAIAFCKDAKLVDKKTHRLTNGEAVSPILDEQLDLFTDPQAVFEGAVKQVVKWVGDRGLSRIYHDIAAGAGGSDTPRSLPPTGPKRKLTDAEERDGDEAEAVRFMIQLRQFHTSELWKSLPEAELEELRAMGAYFAQEAPKLAKSRNRAGR